MLLEVVALAGNVADHLALVGETDLGDLAKRRVRLLRGGRVDARADAALLRVLLHRGNLGFRLLRRPTLADQLVDRRHEALHFLQVTLLRRKMRKGPGGLIGPPGLCLRAAVFSSYVAQAGQRLACQPPPAPGAAAYSRDAYVGQQGAFARGACPEIPAAAGCLSANIGGVAMDHRLPRLIGLICVMSLLLCGAAATAQVRYE